MRVIVGLGNPGTQYDWTPHNVGFLAIDAIAERAGIRVTRPESKSQVGLGKLVGQDVVLAKPQTFMNLSGAAVRMLLEKYESGPEDLIVLSDEAMLPWGTLRIRERGSAGGHNGLNSIIGSLGTNEFIRVRLGVQPEHPMGDMADYVLGVMRKPEREIAAQMAVETAEAVEMILTEGVGKAMTRFNKRVESAEKDSE
ncbi:MAG TPA: aminoacyl-tRNA hydrolase [Candidatus Acidoferrales bacterium]